MGINRHTLWVSTRIRRLLRLIVEKVFLVYYSNAGDSVSLVGAYKTYKDAVQWLEGVGFITIDDSYEIKCVQLNG